jgi:hypothetical protein
MTKIKICGEIPRGVWHEIATRDSLRNGAEWREHGDAVMSIAQARVAYDSGLLTMAQRRDETSFRLVVWMHAFRDDGRKPWFARAETEHDERSDSYAKRTRRKPTVIDMRDMAERARDIARSMDAQRLQVLISALGVQS